MVGPIAEAYVLIKSRIDPKFAEEVRRSVEKELQQVEKDADKAFKSIERDVEKSTKNINRDLSQVGKEAKGAFREVESSGSSAMGQIESEFDTLRDIMRRGLGLDTEIDNEIDRIKIGVNRFRDQLLNNELVLQLDVESKEGLERAKSDIERLRVELQRSAEITIGVDDKAAIEDSLADVERLRAELDQAVNFNIDTNARQVADDIRKRILELKSEVSRALILNVDADVGAAEAEIASLSALLKTIDTHIRINVDADTDPAKTALADLEKQAKAAGGLGSKLFGGGSGDKVNAGITSFGQLSFSLTKVGIAAGAALALIVPIGPALLGIVAAATAVIGALGLAAGSLISVGAAASSLVLAFAAVKIGSLGVGDALKAQVKAQQELSATGEISEATQKKLDAAMKNLAPSARNTVKAFGELSKTYSGLRKAVQQELFKGQAANIKAVGTQYKDLIQGTLVGAAKVFNNAATAAGNFLRSTKGKSTITAILDGMLRSLKSLIPAFGNVAAGIAALFGGSMDSATSFSDTILNLTQRFQDFAERVSAPGGGLKKFLEDAGKAAHVVIDVVVQLGKVLGGIFAAGAGTGVGILSTFADQLRSLSGIIGSMEGQKALAGFFGTTTTAAKAFVDAAGAIKPVLGGIGDVLGGLSGPLDKLRAALLPLATTLGTSLGSALSAVAPFIGSIANSVASAASSIAGALDGILKSLAPLITALSVASFSALSDLAAGLASILANQSVVGVLLGLAGAFLAVSAGVKTIAIAESIMKGFAAATVITQGALTGFAVASNALVAGQGIKASLTAGIAAMEVFTGAASKAAAAQAARTAANEAANTVAAVNAALTSEQALATEGAALSMAQLTRQEILKAASGIAVTEAATLEAAALGAEAIAADVAGGSMTFAASAAAALDAALAVLLLPITAIIAAVAALIAGLVLLYKHSTAFRDAVNAVGNAIKDVFLGALKLVGSAIGAVVGVIKSAIGGLVGIIKSVVSGIGNAIGSLFSGGQIAQVKKAFGDIGTIIKTVFLVDFKIISTAVKIVIGILKLIPQAIGFVIDKFKEFGQATGIFDVVGKVISKFFGFIKTGVGYMFTLLQPLFFALDKLADAAKFVAKLTGIDIGGGKDKKDEKGSDKSSSKGGKGGGNFSDIKPAKVEQPDFSASGGSAKKAALEFSEYAAALGKTAKETREANRETEAANLINNNALPIASKLGLAVSTIAAAQNGNAKASAKVAAALKAAAEAGGDQAKAAAQLQKIMAEDTKKRRESIAAANQLALAQGKYNDVLKGIPKKVGTKIEAQGLAEAAKSIEALRIQYNLTPKQIQTVLKASGIDKTLEQITQVTDAINRTPHDLTINMKGKVDMSAAQVALRDFERKRRSITYDVIIKGPPKGKGPANPYQYLGGQVKQGQQYLTGERGWELYTPNMQGRINGQTQALGLTGMQFFTPPKDGRIIPHNQVGQALKTATNASKEAFSYSLGQSVPPTADSRMLRAIAMVREAIERMKLGLEPRVKLAMGGIFTKSTYAEIGEAGKEVAIPLQQGSSRIRELVQQSGLLNHLSERDFNALIAPRINAVVKATQPPMTQVTPSLSKIAGDNRSISSVLAPTTTTVEGSSVTAAGATTTTNNVRNTPVQANFNLIATSDPDQQAQQIARRLTALMER